MSIRKMLDKVPSIKKPAPVFKGRALVNSEFQDFALSDYFGKYVILVFYAYTCEVCPTEVHAFSDRFEEFKKLDVMVVACSTASESSHMDFANMPREKGGLGVINFPILADPTKKITKMYGIFEETDGISLSGLFIIDNKGILKHVSINDVTVGRSVDEVLRVVQAFQYADENKEMCPANWVPGQEGIKLEPKKPNRKK